MRKEVFAHDGKRQKPILLRKGEKHMVEVSSFRPLFLLDTIWKLLERMIFQRVEGCLDSGSGLTQYGF